METNKKIVLTSYILNAISLFLPILAFFFLLFYVSMLPDTASDKEGWGFGIIFFMIPIVVGSGIFFLISAITAIISKNKYLYVLCGIVIFYYSLLEILLNIAAPDFYLWASNTVFILYIYCFFIFCKRLFKRT